MLACGPTGSASYPFHYANGANTSYLFADGVHPSGAAHAMLANVVLATLSAPGSVSYAAEVPLQVYEDHGATVGRQMFRILKFRPGTGRQAPAPDPSAQPPIDPDPSRGRKRVDPTPHFAASNPLQTPERHALTPAVQSN